MTTIEQRTRQVYDYIITYRKLNGNSPTLREIGDACHVAHTSILTNLARLEGMGWIVREFSKSRGITLGENAPDYDPNEH